MTRSSAYALIFVGAIACTGRAARVVEDAERDETDAVLDRFIAWRLAPAQVAPPTLGALTADARTVGVRGRVTLVRAEDAAWNAWPGPTARLFNNRTAHLFEVEITADGPIRWVPDATQLELNDPGHVLRPAITQEELLEELLFWAFHQERTVIDGDLVERTRGAGALRDAYLPRSADDGVLRGVLAFPLEITAENARFYHPDDDPGDLHVVAMRLTVGLDLDGARRQLVWELE